MALKFCSFASGSSGNCYLVKSENTALLVDVGVTGKRIFAGLEEVNMEPSRIDGILITHEHGDHVKSLRMVSKKLENACVYGSEGTLEKVSDKVETGQICIVCGGEPFWVGDIKVKPFCLSHDAAQPLGYSFCCEDRQVTIVTDTGFISEDMFRHIKEADVLVLEANHEVNILKMGAYPYYLKRRILGDHGHLSNEAAGRCLCQLLKERRDGTVTKSEIPKVVLAHLSKENNTPQQAYLTIRNILFEEDFYISKDLELVVAERNRTSSMMEV